MNGFGFRAVRDGIRYRGEYRLAHWGGWKAYTDSKGEPILFAFPSDAKLAAGNEMVEMLNGCEAYWRGPSLDDAKKAAESLFTRNVHAKTEEEADASR